MGHQRQRKRAPLIKRYPKPKRKKRWKFLSLRQQNKIRAQNAVQRRFDTPRRYVWLTETLRRIRSARGLSQLGLADILGVSRRTIIRWEKQDGYWPRPETMKKIWRLA